MKFSWSSFLLVVGLSAGLAGGAPYNTSDKTQKTNSIVISLYLDGGKYQFAPGEKFTARYSVSGNYVYAWAAIVPSTLPHGDWGQAREQSLQTRYLNDPGTGTLTFQAPAKAGSYELRLFSGYNPILESSVIPFSVDKTDTAEGASSNLLPKISLSMIRSWILPGESMTVNYTLPAEGVEGAWIGIFPANSTETKVLVRRDIYKTGTDTLKVKAPLQPGQFWIKLFKSADSEPLASFEFRVAK